MFPIFSVAAIAGNGCPRGTFPVGGGYCRNIVCHNATPGFELETYRKPDPDAVKVLESNGLSCGYASPQWGDIYIPMR